VLLYAQGVLENCPQDVMLWTNHRVMEWLRSIDLAEYAANLRGSGVHGALMVSSLTVMSCVWSENSVMLFIVETFVIRELDSYKFHIRNIYGSNDSKYLRMQCLVQTF
jgi:hypothetical protein